MLIYDIEDNRLRTRAADVCFDLRTGADSVQRTGEIEDHVRQIYGVEISPQFVSRATEQLQQQITGWQSRPLARSYPVVFVDGLRVAVRTDKGVLKKCVYTVLGVSVPGRQEVLGLWVEETEGARFWLKVLPQGAKQAAFGNSENFNPNGVGLKRMPSP